MLTYNKDLPWQDFARLSIETLDLDPVYVALANSGWSEAKLMRWCVGFITYYDMGCASDVCDLQGDDFWTAIWDRYDTNTRAAERRHFRGEAGKKALKAWRNTYGTPERFLGDCMRGSFLETLNARIPQIGTYFTWKVMDFREAVFGYDVDWTKAEKHMVGLPCDGLKFLFPDEKPEHSVWKVVEAVKHLPNPSLHIDHCNIAVGETIACMAKAYYNNGKHIGTDIVERRNQLSSSNSDNARQLLTVFPLEPTDANLEDIQKKFFDDRKVVHRGDV